MIFTDINECEDEEIRRHCHHGCENTEGSYRCLEPPTTTTTTTTTTPTPIASEEIPDEEEEATDYEEEEEEEQPAAHTTTTSTTSAPVVPAGAPCQDGFRRDVNDVCTGESTHAIQYPLYTRLAFPILLLLVL